MIDLERENEGLKKLNANLVEQLTIALEQLVDARNEVIKLRSDNLPID